MIAKGPYCKIYHCIVCGKVVRHKFMQKHHLIPVSINEASKTTYPIHPYCHKALHAAFTNEDLARQMYTIEMLREHPFVKIIKEYVKNRSIKFLHRSQGPGLGNLPGKAVLVSSRRDSPVGLELQKQMGII